MEKVKFGLKNCYYAKITESGYATPVRLPGAVSLTLSPVGETSEFYADDALYFGEKVNNGYDGSLELALIPESFRKDCLGEVLDSNNVLKE
ncbi:MAG: phage tail protein, partial [Clostridia bacterium]|nr:phage tail protein [Clostridia bacterium]